MIVANIADSHLRAALLGAAHPEEEVVWDPELVLEALDLGYPRLFVETEGADRSLTDLVRDIPVVRISEAEMARWEAGRRSAAIPPGRVEYFTDRLRGLVEQSAHDVSWVDRTLADLTRAAGAPLPPALRAFARRILEFPSFYDDLQPLASGCGTTRGALKARFRRRGLPSPYAYLRWFRIMACANALSDRSVTVAETAHLLGFTSDGNLCRTMASLTGLSPTEVRSTHGWNRLLLSFAWDHLRPDALEGWRDLDDLFLRTVA